MQIQRINTELDPDTLAPIGVTVTLGLGLGQSVEQAVEAVQGLCTRGARPGPTTPTPAPEPATEPELEVSGRPGLNPAAAMAAYDALLPKESRPPAPPRPSVPKVWAGRDGYPDSAVTTTGVSPQHPGMTVLVLADGSKVLAEPRDGILVEVQRKPSATAKSAKRARDELYEANEVTIAPTSRMSGPLAPPPGGDPPRVPHPPVDPDGLVTGVSPEVRQAKTVTAAARAALSQPSLWADGERDGADVFVAWGLRVKPHVPAFKRVAAARFEARIRGIYERETQGD